MHCNRPGLLSLLEQKSRFWKLTDSDHQSFHSKSFKNFNLVKRITRFYYIFSVFTAISFDLQPFTTGLLPTVCYVPDGWFSYLTVVLWYLSYVAVNVLAAAACLFCSLASSLAEQFHLLAHKFRDLCNNNSENIYKEMEGLVTHHNFLIRWVQLFKFKILFAAVQLFTFLGIREN